MADLNNLIRVPVRKKNGVLKELEEIVLTKNSPRERKPRGILRQLTLFATACSFGFFANYAPIVKENMDAILLVNQPFMAMHPIFNEEVLNREDNPTYFDYLVSTMHKENTERKKEESIQVDPSGQTLRMLTAYDPKKGVSGLKGTFLIPGRNRGTTDTTSYGKPIQLQIQAPDLITRMDVQINGTKIIQYQRGYQLPFFIKNYNTNPQNYYDLNYRACADFFLVQSNGQVNDLVDITQRATTLSPWQFKIMGPNPVMAVNSGSYACSATPTNEIQDYLCVPGVFLDTYQLPPGTYNVGVEYTNLNGNVRKLTRWLKITSPKDSQESKRNLVHFRKFQGALNLPLRELEKSRPPKKGSA